MEIELKYTINDSEIADKIWDDEILKKYEEPETREIIFMKSIYFDTENFELCKNDMAYRIRTEGDKIIASLKWGGKTDGALHTREEINVPVSDVRPNPVVFEESEIGKELIRQLDGRPLQSIMEMKIERRRFRIDTGKGLMEVSLDGGQIITENGTGPICEVEVELFSGEQEALIHIGEELQERYNIVSEKRSKFYRGLVLAGQR